ncbi:MAG: hypothetical protein Ct9H300mP1_03150 [Planctomycetaceae bacterium]|nr:MAG: hypothetical protein Ct9H300mP1_03150 [Planctomycetaceae bacterium]
MAGFAAGLAKRETPPALKAVGSEKGPTFGLSPADGCRPSRDCVACGGGRNIRPDDPGPGRPPGVVVGRSAKLISRALKECRKVVAVSHEELVRPSRAPAC